MQAFQQHHMEINFKKYYINSKKIQGVANEAPLKGVIPHGMGKCHEVTKGTAQ